MRSQGLNFLSAALLAVTLVATPALAQKDGEMEIRQGVVEQITNTQITSNHHRGIGAVVGVLFPLAIVPMALLGAGAASRDRSDAWLALAGLAPLGVAAALSRRHWLWEAAPVLPALLPLGALALGGALGTIAVITRQEIVLFIMGGVFVVETVSVMLQVSYFKWTKGKRIFRMAPLHHHFELSGWKETQVVVRFWIISMMLVLVGLSTLKLR